jgi:hypothetical protein
MMHWHDPFNVGQDTGVGRLATVSHTVNPYLGHPLTREATFVDR